MLFESLINIQNIYPSYETIYITNLQIFLSRGIHLSKIACNTDIHTSDYNITFISIISLNCTIRFQQLFHFFIICFIQSSLLLLILLIWICSMLQQNLSCLEDIFPKLSLQIPKINNFCFHYKSPLLKVIKRSFKLWPRKFLIKFAMKAVN